MSENLKTASENINENTPDNITQKIEKVGEKSDNNLEKKIKLSYQGLQELTLFISKQEKKSLKDTLKEINFSDEDKNQLNTLSEEGFQSLKEGLIVYKNIDQSEKNDILSENIDPVMKKIFSESRCKNAQFNTSGNISHHIDGCIMGTINTIIVIGKITIEIIVDLVKIPSDLYALYKGKAQLPDYNI